MTTWRSSFAQHIMAYLIQLHQPHHRELHKRAQAAAQGRRGEPGLASAPEVCKQLRGLPAAVLMYLSPCTQQTQLDLIEHCRNK